MGSKLFPQMPKAESFHAVMYFNLLALLLRPFESHRSKSIIMGILNSSKLARKHSHKRFFVTNGFFIVLSPFLRVPIVHRSATRTQVFISSVA